MDRLLPVAQQNFLELCKPVSIGGAALLHSQTAQKRKLTILQHLSLKVTFPRKGKNPAEGPYGKIKNPPPQWSDMMSEALEALIRLQEKCQAYPRPRRPSDDTKL